MKQNFNMPFTESGITLHFPDLNYFCFENCEGYQKLSGFHFKEMDAGWFDIESNTVYLVELKDFTNAGLRDNIETRVWDLVKKSVDSCVMLASVLIGTDVGKNILACLPSQPFNFKQVKLIHIIKVNDNQAADIIMIRDSFNDKFKAYKNLFGLKSCSVLTYEQAKRHLADWVK
jgi:hypothetical protein